MGRLGTLAVVLFAALVLVFVFGSLFSTEFGILGRADDLDMHKRAGPVL